MVAKLSTTINKIQSLPNFSNIKIINEFFIYMKNNGSAVSHTKSEEGLIKQAMSPIVSSILIFLILFVLFLLL